MAGIFRAFNLIGRDIYIRGAQAKIDFAMYEKQDENNLNEENRNKPWYIISPLSILHLIHWLVMVAVIFVYMIYISFESAFLSDLKAVIIFFIYFLNIIDIITTWLTGIQNKENQIEFKIKNIFLNYLKSYLIIDIFCAIPFDVFTLSSITKRLLRIVQAVKACKYFYFSIVLDGFLLKLRIKPGTIRILKITFNLLSIIQVFSWSFYLLSYYHIDGKNWAKEGRYVDNSLADKYMLCLFWTLQTITTVGYGTITLSNYLEKMYAIVIIIVGATIYSFIVGSISSSVNSDDEVKVKLSEKLATLKQIGSYYRLPDELIERIGQFLKKNNAMEGVATGKAKIPLQKMISELPERLKIELIKYTHKDIISKNSFFFGKSIEFAFNVFSIQTETTYSPDDIIYKKGEPAEEVYIIYSGSVKLISDDYIPFIKYSEGSYFGEIEVIFKQERTSTAYTDKETVLGIIKRDQLNKIFKDFMSEEEEFKQVAIKRKENNQIALENAIKREQEVNPNKSSRFKIMEKFSKFLSYQMLMDGSKQKRDKTKTPTSKKWRNRYDIVNTPVEEKSQKAEVQVNPENDQDTMLNIINGNAENENEGEDLNESTSTTKSNFSIIHDVLEVRNQVEKFRDLLESSKQAIVQFEI